jgi:hypothetical protein
MKSREAKRMTGIMARSPRRRLNDDEDDQGDSAMSIMVIATEVH